MAVSHARLELRVDVLDPLTERNRNLLVHTEGRMTWETVAQLPSCCDCWRVAVVLNQAPACFLTKTPVGDLV